ncbi:primosomal protein N' [uncultured Eubacterium sp.]|uniref:replication restart helicase PriA n=1 Tax=uncultured Eubacterium sp. TaxID=165185 RepID=UPI0025979627|nr:primosomal protein N' [uncultured Eubacterium sp.]
MDRRFADIIIDITHEKLDRTFQYIIPDELLDTVKIGSVVSVPFGKGNKEIKGYVINITDKPKFDINKTKSILRIDVGSDNSQTKLIELAAFIKQTYGGTMSQALRCVLPIKTKTKPIESIILKLSIGEEDAKALIFESERKNAKARARFLRELIDVKEIPQNIVLQKLNIGRQTINKLVEMGVVEKIVISSYRNPISGSVSKYDIVLNDEQREVVESIDKSESKVHLIHGVTGSGKTEVYIELIDRVIKEGGEAIVLIPEIALTFQTVMRFRRKFNDLVSIINSKLSQGEKYDQFERAKNGEVKIIIGPRSALFTPFKNLKLIIIDEEHERTYKSEQVPKYHARDVAIKRAELEGAKVVLGSATPSIESYYHALGGEFVLHELSNRANGATLSDVSIVDMRDELKSGNKLMFSRKLLSLMEDRLSKKEQIMIFINRRGYASFVSCRSCGFVYKCPHCDVALKYHANGKLICHYCGYETATSKICPECGSKYIKTFGTGTQRVEGEINKLFPNAKTLRMDFDTTRKKGDYEKILSAFANGEADILIGTQMIVKGHDFANVTLVGIIAADLSLYAQDFRASETTFELLTQAAGRAGRGSKKGEVVIQTYDPDNYSITLSKKQDYKAFYNQEIAYRKLLKYPPIYNMAVILITGEDEDVVFNNAKLIFDYLDGRKGDSELFGPTWANIKMLNDNYRCLIYLKDENVDNLSEMNDILERYVEDKDIKNINIQYDLIPMSGY